MILGAFERSQKGIPMRWRLGFVLMMIVAFALPACGSLPTGKVPTDSTIKPWQPPEEDELLEQAGGDDSWDDDEEEAEPAAPADGGAEASPAPATTAGDGAGPG